MGLAKGIWHGLREGFGSDNGYRSAWKASEGKRLAYKNGEGRFKAVEAAAGYIGRVPTVILGSVIRAAWRTPTYIGAGLEREKSEPAREEVRSSIRGRKDRFSGKVDVIFHGPNEGIYYTLRAFV